jgi:hypothetical protein
MIEQPGAAFAGRPPAAVLVRGDADTAPAAAQAGRQLRWAPSRARTCWRLFTRPENTDDPPRPLTILEELGKLGLSGPGERLARLPCPFGKGMRASG